MFDQLISYSPYSRSVKFGKARKKKDFAQSPSNKIETLCEQLEHLGSLEHTLHERFSAEVLGPR